jgi:hypothetical protein
VSRKILAHSFLVDIVREDRTMTAVLALSDRRIRTRICFAFGHNVVAE